MANLLEFSWSVVAQGYEWVRGEPHSHVWTNKEFEQLSADNRYLVGRDTYGGLEGTHTVQHYYPLSKKHADLWQAFAAVDPTAIGIQQFADKHGLLGGKYSVGVKFITVAPRMVELRGNWRPDALATRIRYTDNYATGEPFIAWVKHISMMKQAFNVWSLLQKQDEAGLREYVKWRHLTFTLVNPETGENLTSGRAVFAFEDAAGERRLVQGETLRPARVLLADLINDNLKGQVSPLTLCHIGLEKTTLRFVPESLLGALWLQFAQAVDKSHAYKQCEACSKWFDVSKKVGARVDKKTCNDTCKKRLYRRRRREKSSTLTR
jgi:hypothetical protein